MYELQVEPRAQKELARLPDEAYRRVERAIDALARQPRPRRAKKLRGAGSYRIRVGEHRVIYAVFDKERLIKVLQIARRTTTTYGDV